MKSALFCLTVLIALFYVPTCFAEPRCQLSAGPTLEHNADIDWNYTPQTLKFKDGSFAVIWLYDRSSDEKYYFQKIDHYGQKVGQPTIFANKDLPGLKCVVDANDNIIITWYGFESGEARIYVQKFSSSFIPLSAPIIIDNDPPYRNESPEIAINSQGNIVVVWMRWDTQLGDNPTPINLYGRVLNSKFEFLSEEFRVNVENSIACDQKIDILENGNFYIVFLQTLLRSNTIADILIQRFDRYGQKIDTNIVLVKSDKVPRCSNITAFNDLLIIEWRERSDFGDPENINQIAFQKYSFDLQLLGPKTIITDKIGSGLSYLNKNLNDNFVVCWTDNYNNSWVYFKTYFQLFNKLGAPLTDIIEVQERWQKNSVPKFDIAYNQNNLVVAWDKENTERHNEVYTSSYTLRCIDCENGIQDGDELGVDCGGSCPNSCPTCFDGIKNGDEQGIDCGGHCSTSCREITFLRGDANWDFRLDIADPIMILGYLFAHELVNCEDACDANDSSLVDIADPVYLLGYIFADESPPPLPFPELGFDPTLDPYNCLGGD